MSAAAELAVLESRVTAAALACGLTLHDCRVLCGMLHNKEEAEIIIAAITDAHVGKEWQ